MNIGALDNPLQQESSSSSGTLSTERSKRIQVPAACQRCRQRKQKCDATRPVCNRCRDSNTACIYDSNNNETPRQSLKRRYGELGHNYTDLLGRIQDLASQDDAYALQLLRRIRAGEPAESVLSSLKTAEAQQPLARSSSMSSSEPRLEPQSGPDPAPPPRDEGSDAPPDASVTNPPASFKPWDL